MDSRELIKALQLEPHREGGYFRRTYSSDVNVTITTEPGTPSKNATNGGVQRSIMSSIFYLLTSETPIMRLHFNRSDIIHYFHLGSPVEFIIIYPNGQLVKETLGTDILSGEKVQLLVPGGTWRAAAIKNVSGEGFSLTSEAVAPGFDYDDNKLATAEEIKSAFPNLWKEVEKYVKQ